MVHCTSDSTDSFFPPSLLYISVHSSSSNCGSGSSEYTNHDTDLSRWYYLCFLAVCSNAVTFVYMYHTVTIPIWSGCIVYISFFPLQCPVVHHWTSPLYPVLRIQSCFLGVCRAQLTAMESSLAIQWGWQQQAAWSFRVLLQLPLTLWAHCLHTLATTVQSLQRLWMGLVHSAA